MINFRVDSIAALLKKFTEQGIKVIGEPQVYDYGTFLHIEDPEGNKIELWEPVGDSFEDEKQNEAI